MATNVSSLRVAIRGDVSGLQAELTKGTASIQKFNTSFQRSQRMSASAANSFGLSSGQASQAVSQLGFAVEDALVSFGNQGLGGALRAAGNNLSFVAAMMNPIAGIVVGVGTALSAIFIPKLFESTEEVKTLDDALQKLGRTTKEVSLDLQHGLNSLDVPVIEPAFERPVDRFEQQRRAFRGEVDKQREDFRHAQSLAVDALSGFSDPLFIRGGNTAPFTDAQEGFAKSIAKDVPNLLRQAFETAALTGSPEVIDETTRQLVGRMQSLSASQERKFGRGIDPAIIQQVVEAGESLVKISESAALARENTDRLNSALGTLSKNQAEAQQRAAFGAELTKRLGPALQVGGRFGDVLKEIGAGFMSDFGGRGRQGRSRLSTGELQGGFQFGSREAVSALNRVLHTRVQAKTEEKIEKNTSKTADGIQNLATEIKNLGKAGVQAIAGDAL